MYAGISRTPIRRWPALALLGLATCALAQQADSGVAAYAIRMQNAAQGTAAGWTLAIAGEWATQCPPTLENVTLDGSNLRIDARSVLGLCMHRAMPFSIELNPTLALNQSALAPGVYRVSFYAADGAQAQPKLRAFALIDRSAPDAATIAPETGFWWSANGDASGANRSVLSMEMQDHQLSVALLSYDPAGQPVWYFGAAPFAARIAHVPLLRLAGGSDPFSPATATPHGDSALTLDLQFESGAHASAWLGRSKGNADDATVQLQPLDLVRLPLAEVADGHAWQGDWVLVDDRTTPPQRLHLDHFHALDAEHFQLDDNTAGSSLICTRDAAQPDLPPSSCSLRRADGAESARFDSVAIARMDGTSIHLLRISP